MRSRGPSKQRLWMGAGRHLCCSGRKYTYADAHGYSDSYRHSNSYRHCYSNSDHHANCQPYSNSIGNRHAATDANAEVEAIAKAPPHAFAQAIELVLEITGDRSPV